MKNSKINLQSLINVFSYWGYKNTADYFKTYDSSDGYIDSSIVKNHIIPSSNATQSDYDFWREISLAVEFN
jgi:hypothetical protein